MAGGAPALAAGRAEVAPGCPALAAGRPALPRGAAASAAGRTAGRKTACPGRAAITGIGCGIGHEGWSRSQRRLASSSWIEVHKACSRILEGLVI